MKFYIAETKEFREITLCPWTGSGYGPDCFADLEVCFPLTHDRLAGDGAYICTADEYAQLAEWWVEEVRLMNAREIGQNGDDYEELQGDELVLTAE